MRLPARSPWLQAVVTAVRRDARVVTVVSPPTNRDTAGVDAVGAGVTAASRDSTAASARMTAVPVRMAWFAVGRQSLPDQIARAVIVHFVARVASEGGHVTRTGR